MCHDDPEVERLLQCLAKLPTAAPTLDEALESSGLDREAFHDAMEAADLSCLISTWEDSPDGPAVMLSPLAAGRMGLKLEEVGGGSGRYLFRWVPECAASPKVLNSAAHRQVLASDLAGGDRSPSEFLDHLPDPKALEPLELAARSEHLEAILLQSPKEFAKYRQEKYYGPTILLGLRRPWAAAVDTPGEPCLGCGGRPLDLLAYCCRCDRSGVDHLMPPPPDKRERARLDKQLDQLCEVVAKAKPGKAASKPKASKAKGAGEGRRKAVARA